ncbi:hypothetical protein ACFL2P_00655 [Candidatus Moduliflexota bacterium]
MKGLEAGDFEKDDLIVQIGRAPRRIDILTSISGVDFDSAWGNRDTVEIEGLKIPVLSREDLVHNKKAFGRPQDIADLQRLDSLRGETEHQD